MTQRLKALTLDDVQAAQAAPVVRISNEQLMEQTMIGIRSCNIRAIIWMQVRDLVESSELPLVMNGLTDTFIQLTVPDYRFIVGLLHAAIEEDSPIVLNVELNKLMNNPAMSEVLRRVARTMLQVSDEISKSTREAAKAYTTQRNFASGMLLYFRTLYPNGINVMNPDQIPDVPESADLSRPCRLDLAKGQVQLSILNSEGGYKIHVVIDDKTGNVEGGKRVEQEFDLPENKPLTVGRVISLERIFGRKEDARNVAVDIMIQHPMVPRDGMMILRRGDQLYVYDRGAQSPVRMYANDRQMEYIPKKVVSAAYTE